MPLTPRQLVYLHAHGALGAPYVSTTVGPAVYVAIVPGRIFIAFQALYQGRYLWRGQGHARQDVVFACIGSLPSALA